MKPRLTKCLIDFADFNLNRPVSDTVRIIEICAVALTGVGKFVFMDYLDWRLPFVIVAILSWAIYVGYRYKKDRQILSDWGFRIDNFKAVLKMLMPFALFSIVTCLTIGYVQGTLNISWHIIPLLITYPIWGTIQQFLTIGLVAGNLSALKSLKLKKWTVILITAVLFAMVHFPNVWILIATFLLALCYGYIYLKAKNLYVLGLFHGWLGALFYYTVLNQDPFADVFLKWLN